jgi:hypothetical protein
VKGFEEKSVLEFIASLSQLPLFSMNKEFLSNLLSPDLASLNIPLDQLYPRYLVDMFPHLSI